MSESESNFLNAGFFGFFLQEGKVIYLKNVALTKTPFSH